MVAPIRESFNKDNKLKKLLDTIKKFEVTR